LIKYLQFLWLCNHSYWAAKKKGGTHYGAVLDFHGVPLVALFVGVDRDSWRISQRAIEEMEEFKKHHKEE